jgi:hypothetical protein
MSFSMISCATPTLNSHRSPRLRPCAGPTHQRLRPAHGGFEVLAVVAVRAPLRLTRSRPCSGVSS